MSAIEAERGVGDCPERPEGFGHVWAGVKASGDERNPCRFCGYPGRGSALKGEHGFFQEATARVGNRLVEYVMPDEATREARAAVIVADKKRRDAEAVASGTARPGQVAGAPKGGKS
jgi:hypothetical protein